MPVIVMATPKGGAGKSTTSLVLALTLASRGAKVSLVDADANQPLVRWADNRPRSVRVIGKVTEETFVSMLDQENAARDCVIVDLEGAATRIMTRAIVRSDLVLIPMQPSALDAEQAGRMVGLVRQEQEVFRRTIPLRVVMTRTSDRRSRLTSSWAPVPWRMASSAAGTNALSFYGRPPHTETIT